jgi:hypothetical protein
MNLPAADLDHVPVHALASSRRDRWKLASHKVAGKCVQMRSRPERTPENLNRNIFIVFSVIKITALPGCALFGPQN